MPKDQSTNYVYYNFKLLLTAPTLNTTQRSKTSTTKYDQLLQELLLFCKFINQDGKKSSFSSSIFNDGSAATKETDIHCCEEEIT